MRACMHAQSYPTLWDPMDCSPPGCSVHGVSQARILEQVAISSSREYSDLEIEPMSLADSPALVSRFFTTEPPINIFTWSTVSLDMLFFKIYFIYI